ncbi:hypothetical protein WJX73_009917 [Symbiochloris irregularis]|uniref:Uncharacterized protein n=1 Tax=Symbiochloris irregularis TaxID=706552 RepID=A0AAW1NT52_9CHLO
MVCERVAATHRYVADGQPGDNPPERQIERWEVDPSPSRSHKLKFFGGRTVARWQSVWNSGVDLVASYNQARLQGALPRVEQAAQLRQKLLECLSPSSREISLAKAERQEAEVLQQLKEIATKVHSLAGKVRQCHLDERADWEQWLSRPIPEAPDLREQQEVNASIHRQAMEHTEAARQRYISACHELKKALGRQAELQSFSDLAVVERQLLQFKDKVDYEPQWDAKDLHKPYAGMKFRTEGRSSRDGQVFAVQKLHCGVWVDWVYIGQSSILGAGRGIFAARPFEQGDFIGRYLGRVLGFKADFTDAVLKAYQSPYLLTVRAPGRGGRNIVIDAALPIQHEAEQREIAAIPALDISKPDWAVSEILWDYTDQFWAGRNRSA